ncbi:Oidioi.mRNA.OKI2018_I69.chr1.g31.t1.cds [Oikopleura dioica]|uniref:Oidioi.mRNA.OKI2018_I69.chr1.g31.t1.cds n=1 Tax=Oikopleura dioica TaxID=34765 RepID=A0ABN7SMD9_OIKDI|nr:Oidioi.mRNA.OKI2018_I69.chr1.g31.t1.cds [Oikopleura dioica]
MSYFDDDKYGDVTDPVGSAFDSGDSFQPQDTSVTIPQPSEQPKWAMAPRIFPSSQQEEHVEINEAPIYRAPEIVVDSKISYLGTIEKKFRAKKGDDIQVRKERLIQFLQIIQNRHITVFQTPTLEPEFYLSADNFREADPDFVAYVISKILPGCKLPETLVKPCNFYDDRLYQFSIRKTACCCLNKPEWDDLMPPSEEDLMIMEVTGWTKRQLYKGMNKAQEDLMGQYVSTIFLRFFLYIFIIQVVTILSLMKAGII